MNETQPTLNIAEQRIIALKANNIKRLTAVEIKFDESGVVIVTGDNGAGKSSLLDSIALAFNPEYIPDVTIRRGEEKARVVVETQDLIVTRRFTEKSDYLEVKTRDGVAQSSPQTLLDSLISRVGFDPFSFSEMDDKEQAAELLRICPVALDLDANAAAVKKLFNERTEKNRDVTRLEAQKSEFKHVPVTRPEPVDTTAVLEERKRREESNKKRDDLIQNGKEKRQALIDRQAEVKRLQDELAEAERLVGVAKEELAQATKLFKEHGDALTLDDLDTKLTSAAQVATDITLFDRYESIQNELRDARVASNLLTDKIDALRKERDDALHGAQFPVKGLSMDYEGNVLFNNLPLKQASQAQRIKIGVALAAAANPKLKVAFIRDGSLLDKSSMETLKKLATAYGLQIFVERVEDTSPTAIHIVDGAVAA